LHPALVFIDAHILDKRTRLNNSGGSGGIQKGSRLFVNLIEFTDTEQAHEDENEETEVMGPPKKTRGATRKAARKSTVNMELESKRLDMERDRMKSDIY
jgi:hypothetical protein